MMYRPGKITAAATVAGMALSILASCSSGMKVTVSNPLSYAREGEMVEIPRSALPKGVGEENLVVVDSRGEEIPRQFTGDGLLIFPAEVGGGASATFRIRRGTPTAVEPKVYGRKFPEHKDNMNWENDKAAYVAYGPALQARGERGFGYDVWTKSVDTLVIEQRNWDRDHGKSLHRDHGNGMDCYTVANTLGAGTAALLADNGEIIFPWAWKEYEIIDNGPLRFRVRLTYNPLVAGEDTAVVEQRLITLDRGSHFNHMEVTYNGLTRGRKVAPGIVVHEQNPKGALYSTTDGWIAYCDSTDNARNNNGVIYLGVVTSPEDKPVIVYRPVDEPAKHALGHMLAVMDYNPGDTLSYWWGSAWSKAPGGPESPEQWRTFMERSAQCLRNPLKVKY